MVNNSAKSIVQRLQKIVWTHPEWSHEQVKDALRSEEDVKIVPSSDRFGWEEEDILRDLEAEA